MEAKVVLKDGMKFEGSASSTADTGLSVALDAGRGVGGEDQGFRPLELMAISLAGCTAMDVISILRKKRQDITTFEVQTHIEQADGHPHVFTHIKIDYIISGRNIDEKALKRAIELSETKYCPAQAMLGKVAPMELNYTIHEVE